MGIALALWDPIFPELNGGIGWRDSLAPDPFASSGSWQDYAPQPLYGYTQRPSASYGLNYDPLSSSYGALYDPAGELAGGQIDADIQAYLDREFPELNQFNQPTVTNPGQMASPGGAWADVDKWNALISQAQAKVQASTGVYVPGNLIKAIMRVESGGVWVDSDPGAGATGVMQVMPFWGPDLGLNLLDPAQNIEAGVRILAMNYQTGDLDGNPSWEWAARRYLGLGGPDAYGTDHNVYWDRVSDYINELNQTPASLDPNGGAPIPPGGFPGQQTPGQGGIDQFKAIWGFDAPITQEYGPTEFSQGNPWYDYAADYNFSGHPGVDVGIVAGTKLYSPVGGRVEIAGGTPYYTDVRYGSSPQTGELYIRLANGDALILGHMGQINVHVGDMVTPGQMVGLSGTNNGDHVHVEYRKVDPTWNGNVDHHVQADPRLALNGVFTGTYTESPGVGVANTVYGAGTWNAFMRSAASGGVLPGPGQNAYGGSSSGWHDWLRSNTGVGPTPVAYWTPQTAPSAWTFTPITGGTGSTGPGGQQIVPGS